ncbi:hypothetical protein M4R22_21555 [Acidovorax sp. GBBC 3334]|uniref:hypothetical protein n=1 Tax=Acidovorax sp. GBBC 3334 TaxID=2940496 RepID=UPI0023028B82|nr:hypothetical protein [Acidovorax sp. GBBC 3334]MDA8457355.1 hypothetical protein [Acidovorax sp. GBBC 3334]
MSILSDISRARTGDARRLRGGRPSAGAPWRPSRLPLQLVLAQRTTDAPVRNGAADRAAPAWNADADDGIPPSPARQLMERFQFCELDAMQRSQMRHVVEFLGGRGKALRTAPLQANWKALRAAFSEAELREVIVERTAAVVGILLRPEPVGERRVSILGLPRDEALVALRRGGMTEADIDELRTDILAQLRRGGSTSGEWLRAKYQAFVADDFTRSGVYVSYVRLFSPAHEACCGMAAHGEA